uniref:Cilia- and flagella-associated protein 97 n=1 Tax=Leptobrachium leishanense TaxID=445787 RepID=A0A8C5LNB4_9ANUR
MDRYENLFDDEDVDHSFFDSDNEDEKGNKEVAASFRPSKREEAKNQDDLKEESRNRDSDTEKATDKGERNKNTTKVINEHDCTESVSPVRPRSPAKSGRSSVQSLRIETTVPTGIPSITHESEDNYYPDEDDSSEEERHNPRPKSSKQTSVGKKSAGKYSRDAISSSISSSDTEFSDNASDDRLSKSSFHSSKEKGRFSEIKGPKQPVRDLRDHTTESEDTVTDVTPLSTPDISPIQSFDLVATSDALKNKVKRQDNVCQDLYDPDLDPKTNSKVLQDAMDLNQLLKAFRHLDYKDQQSLVVDNSAARHKNYSFTNEEVQHIDRENQRLLRELSKQAAKPRSKSLTPKKHIGVPVRLYHSTLNRQKEQQRIERENLALLKRLESVKPTVGMTRSEQLMDYQRQAGYLNTAALSPRMGKTSVSRLSSSSSAGGYSRVSSGCRSSERTNSSVASLRPAKSSNVRAAWM